MEFLLEKLIALLAQQLLQVSSFEDAAVATLRSLLKIADECLQNSAYNDQGNLQRATIHLRPAGSYRGLVVLDHSTNKPMLPDQDIVISSILPSTTVWRLVEDLDSAIGVDVQLGQYQVLSNAETTFARLPASVENNSYSGSESLQRLLNRGATHLLMLPLYGPGKTRYGIISLEACCHPAKGRSFVWEQCIRQLQLLANLAAPTVIGLPLHTSISVQEDSLLPVIGSSMANLISLLKVFAQQDETILISGPTGTGKSRLAEWCHAQSARCNGPFSTMDLLTVPEDMQMAYLTGWVKGAFTDAKRNYQGYIARAKGGTLFIDEIDKLSMGAQAGLLHFLETHRYQVLGDPGDLQEADVRIIIGTNIDLQKGVAEGLFRRDLYFRINVLPVHLAPLSERVDEIPAWARFMVARRNQEVSKKDWATLSADAALALTRYSWPGNLRQLDNVTRRAYTLALVEQGADAAALSIKLQHIEQALDFESQGYDATLTSILQRAAMAFVDEALAFEEQGKILSVNHAAAFKGLVLLAAQQRFDDLKRVYELFGNRKMIEGRNHNRDYQRECLKVMQFSEALDKTFAFEIPDITNN